MIGRVSIGWILLNLFIQSLSEGNCLFYRNCVSAVFKRIFLTKDEMKGLNDSLKATLEDAIPLCNLNS